MLQDTDLKAFLSAFERSAASDVLPTPPEEALTQADGLFPPEIRRLGCSLQIAAVLGDAPDAAAVALRMILARVRELRCVSLEDQHAWARAIAWTRIELVHVEDAAQEALQGREREAIVGAACWRLREQGFKIEVGAYGPKIAESSRRDIVRKAEAFVALLGGLETASQVLRFLHENKRSYDGLWLFGTVGLNLYDVKRPMIPVGWLFSLAIRHLNSSSRARKPEIAWKSLTDLATDFAAAHDCQRYNQFEGMQLHPTEFHRQALDSTLWREFFSLPQMPAKALQRTIIALKDVITGEDEAKLRFKSSALIDEFQNLLIIASDYQLCTYSRADIEKSFPIITRLPGGGIRAANVDYVDPLAADERTQDSVLLFAYGRNRVAIMPRAFLAAAICEYVFRSIWTTLGNDRGGTIVGKTLEIAISRACSGKAEIVVASQKYPVGKRSYEFDIAARDGDRIVLIETKGKSITQRSRSGDMFAFFKDYSDSFLRLLGQLVRHEVHLRNGQTPLTYPSEATSDFRPLKVAVSPLSYGPVSDKVLSSAILRSLAGAKFTLVSPDAGRQKVVDTVNKRAERLIMDMVLVAPKEDGLADLAPYLIDVFWVDVGQLLYVLERSIKIWDAFSPLKHITFSSRDFWTEVAHVDRSGMTQGRWRPATA